MRRLFVGLFVLLSVGAFAACGGDDESEAPASSNSNSMDAGMSDDDGSTDTTEDMSVCTPIESCGPDQCGVVDDGCGGTVECATECPCVDGVAAEPTCGVCGLGVQNCGLGETGVGECLLPEALEESQLDDCDADVIYVSTAGTADDPDGTISAPFKSLQDASETWKEGDVIVLHAPESNPLNESIKILVGVTIVGGFDADFRYQPGTKAYLRENGTQERVSDFVYTLSAIGGDEPLILSGLDIDCPDVVQNDPIFAVSTYGVWLTSVTDARIYDSVIRAGSGSDGFDGEDGENGTDGGRGVDGSSIYGAPGGENPDCPLANGGDGGDGGRETTTPDRGGFSAGNIEGGRPGLSTNRTGGVGMSAPPVNPGADGTSATYMLESSVQRFQSFKHFGSDGEDGRLGYGGGGGGGAFYTDLVNPDYIIGPGGAGGGAGGCGGTAGTGGSAGGGSFGIWANTSNLRIVRTVIEASDGGDGGDGGVGGLGGSGGQEGEGTSKGRIMPEGRPYTSPVLSGDGGDGADGGDGGSGGAGAGGPSHAIVCDESTLDADEETLSQLAVGVGGTGGNSPVGKADDAPNDLTVGCGL